MGLKERAKDAARAAAERASAEAKGRLRRDDQEVPREAPAGSGDAAIFRGTSRDDGRNAVVTLYRDRLERVKSRSMGSMSRARQDTEVTPVRAVSSVQAKKDGHRTLVTVFASGNNIDFRFEHNEAQQFKDALMALVLGSGSPEPRADEPDPVEQIRRLGELRDQGLVTEAEFDAKKAAILERM